MEDATTLTAWATDELLRTHRRDLGRLRLTVLEHCRMLKLKPPSAHRLNRILTSALAAYTERFCTGVVARLADQSCTALKALPTTIAPASPDADAPTLAAARRTVLQVLKSDPGPMVVETAREEVDELQYSQLKQCSSSEVTAAITGVLRHCTTISVERHYLDSHGQSEVAFGLCHLLGYNLCPRLKPIHCQKLYLPSNAHAERYPGLKPGLARAIDWELIAQQYDELVKYAAALQTGTAEAEAILAHFTRQTSHPTYKALAELGRVVKTIFLCRYLHDEAFRQEIQEGLNVIEN